MDNNLDPKQPQLPFMWTLDSEASSAYRQLELALTSPVPTLINPRLQKLRERVEKKFLCSAHDIDHTRRVFNLCLKLAENENVDLEILQAAALLHDIARVREDKDRTGKTDHAALGAEMAAPILQKLGFSEEDIRRIQHCIVCHRYRTGNRPQTLEAMILFDADKLDGIGAIGIARSFVWLGRNNAKIFEKVNVEDYVTKNQESKNHGKVKEKNQHNLYIEYEIKIKHIKGLLHTKKAKEIAANRLRYYGSYLKRIEREINGEL